MLKPFIAIAVFVAGVLAFAETGVAASIRIDDAWSPAQTDTSKTGAVFLKISNDGTETDTLVSIETPIAEVAQLHMSKSKGGKMRMRKKMTLDVKPGEAITLRHGGLHVMLVDLASTLEIGARFPLTLNFEKNGSVEVEVTVKMAGGM